MTNKKIVEYLSELYFCPKSGKKYSKYSISQAVKNTQTKITCSVCSYNRSFYFPPDYLPPNYYTYMYKPSEWVYRERGKFGKGWYKNPVD